MNTARLYLAHENGLHLPGLTSRDCDSDRLTLSPARLHPQRHLLPLVRHSTRPEGETPCRHLLASSWGGEGSQSKRAQPQAPEMDESCGRA